MDIWEVDLAGEAFDLAKLPQWFHDAQCCVVNINGQYQLRSTHFHAHDESTAVLEHARALVALINGAVKLCRSNALPIRVTGGLSLTSPDGRSRSFVNPPPAIARFARPGKIEAGPPQGLLELAGSSVRVAGVLQVLAQAQPSWPQLWVASELIRKASPEGKAIVTRHPLNGRFTSTANNWHVLGIDARHGRLDQSPPSLPLPYSDALRFVLSIAHSWFEHLLSTS